MDCHSIPLQYLLQIEHLVGQRLLLILSGVSPGALGVFVRGVVVEQAAMYFAVDIDKAIIDAAVNNERKLIAVNQVDEAHYRVGGEVLWVIGFRAQDGCPELGALGCIGGESVRLKLIKSSAPLMLPAAQYRSG